ncbi:MAG: hypothetical protein JNM34_12885, partial [Chthonomonadaceae bacterium]|nr:hypothetical protein [Chthonomonadaceae bacterium]
AVIEACEAYDSLRDFDPFVVVLTNLELDHIDFHGTWPSLKESVLDFVCKVPPDGAFIYCSDDDGVFEFLGDLDGRCPNGKQTLGYGFRNRLAEMSPEEKKRGGPVFAVLDKLIDKSRELCPSEAWVDHLWLAGRHNALNALGALLACEEAGADREKAIAGILSYRGAERRLEILSEGEVTVIDDYAHHPTEIKASLEAVRSRWMSPGSSGKRLIVVYQPHLYTRTAPLIAEFAEALSLADEVVLTDIYPAREDPLPGVSSFRIAELVRKPCHYVPQRHLLPRKVAKLVRPGDVVVGMGAGNISEFAPALLDELGRLSRRPQGPSVATTSEILIPTQVGSLASLGVTVLYGGDSAEREVSILSSMSVGAALRRRGHEVTLFDVSEALLTTGDLSCLTGMDRPDAVFLEVHGTNAEDGSIQGLLELLHIPYTGSGVQASAIAMDKHLTKSVLESAGLPVPKGVLLKSLEEFDGHAIDLIVSGTLSNGGWVVKPNAQGSTVGLTFVTEHEGLRPAVEKAFQYGDTVLIEEWLQGVEISVPVMSGQAFPVVEILPNKGQYDFANKYTPGATDEICPARLNP